MKLCADLVLTRGALRIAASFEVDAGQTLALVGPNGAGKSSCLSALAGLLRLSGGSIRLGERVLDGGQPGSFVPPERRAVGMVFQDARLFPHMSVLDNVAFGPRSRGVGRSAARGTAAAWLARVGIAPALHAFLPAALSGGQAQRVALARALASAPDLLLLDEPLSAVDASGRLELRRTLREHLLGFAGPRVIVVHDIADALALADRILVLEDGRQVQSGTIGELLRQPRSRYVADLIGLNCFVGVCRDREVAIGDARLTVATPQEGEVLLTLHPRAVALFLQRPDGSPRNLWRAPVVALETQLDRVRVQLGGALPIVAEVTPAAVAALDLKPGREVWVAVKATEIAVVAR